MGLTFNLGRDSAALTSDASLNVGIGGSPSGSYKLEVTGTAKVSSTLLVSGALTGTNASFVGTGDFSSGALTLTLGADNGLTTRTNATQKIAKIVSYNYTNANNPVGMMVANNDGTDNALWIGGGSGAVTAATSLTFFTAANNNTATGTARLTIASTGIATFTNNLYSDGLIRSNLGIFQVYAAGSLRGGYYNFASAIGSGTDYTPTITSETGLYFLMNGNIIRNMSLLSNGNLLIGTTTDNGYKLQVAAEMYSTGYNVANTGGSFQTIDAGGYISLKGATGSPANAILFGAAGTERARIIGSGVMFQVGTNYSGSAGDWIARIKNASTTGYGLDIQAGNGSGNTPLLVRSYNGGVDFFTLRGDGLMTVGGALSAFNFNPGGQIMYVNSSGQVGSLSSTRESKININTISNIDYIYKLNPVSFYIRKKDEITYEYTEEHYEEIRYGFIADEVEKLNKDLVCYSEKDGENVLSSVDYISIIPILVKAIQEQQAIITSLQDRLAKGGL